MKPFKLITFLYEQFVDINEKVPRINHGGCGVFAEKLYMVLCNLGLTPKLIVITDNRKGMNERVKGEDNWSDKFGYASITHIVVKIGKHYVDSTGIYSSVKYVCEHHAYRISIREVSTTLTIDTLKDWNNNPYIWNDSFNRRHIKTIENKLEKVCNMAKKNLVVTK
jgi:hypothetical protein